VLANGKQFLLLIRLPLCYSFIQSPRYPYFYVEGKPLDKDLFVADHKKVPLRFYCNLKFVLLFYY